MLRHLKKMVHLLRFIMKDKIQMVLIKKCTEMTIVEVKIIEKITLRSKAAYKRAA